MNQTLHDSEGSGDFRLVGCPNFEIPVCLEFRRPFAKCLSETFTKVQFSFTLGGIAIGEPLLADVMDRGDDFLKFGDAKRSLLNEDILRFGSLLFRRTRSSHSRVEKSN